MSRSIYQTAPSTPSPVIHYTITNHTHHYHQAPLHSHQSQIPPSLITLHPLKSHSTLTNHTLPSPITVHHHQSYMYTPTSPITHSTVTNHTLYPDQSHTPSPITHSTLTNHTPPSLITLHHHQSHTPPSPITHSTLPNHTSHRFHYLLWMDI